MVEHTEKGAFGLVINRPLETALKEFLSFFEIDYVGPPDRSVLFGGPVGLDRLCFLHTNEYEWEETVRVDDSIRVSFSLEGLREVSEAGEADFLVFVGSSGWGPYQLENEVSGGAWFPHQASRELIFHTPHERMWHEAFRSMGVDPLMMRTSRTIQ